MFPKPTRGHGGVDPIPTVVPTPTEYESATDSAFSTLWVVFALMIVSSIVFTVLSWRIPVSRRVFHIITTIITLTSAAAYFAMASGHASTYHCTAVRDHHKHIPDTFHDVCRQVYWARYIQWAITSPLILLNLGLLAGVSGAHTLIAIVADEFLVFSALFASFSHAESTQKWGWFAIGIISFFVVVWHVALHGSRAVKAKAKSVGRLFTPLLAFTFILWAVYFVIWGLAEGSRRISVDAEVIAYSVLDILTKGVYGFWLLFAYKQIAASNVEIGGYWANGASNEGRIRIGDDEAA